MKRTFEQNGFIVIVERVPDEQHEAETPAQQQANYSGCTEAEKAKYFVQDQLRYEAWMRDEWCYMGVTVSIRKQTSSNWLAEVGYASVWGIESDSDFAEFERDMIAEAFAEVERLKEELSPGIDDLRAVVNYCLDEERKDSPIWEPLQRLKEYCDQTRD